MRMTGGARRCGGHLRRRIASSLPVLLAALALASCSVVERPASRRLNDEIARIRAAGEPLTFEELRADQSAGDGADAASDYRAAAVLLADLDTGPLFGLLHAYRAGTRSCPPVPPSTEVREGARRMLAQSQPALELIDRAARKEACYYAFNLETGEFPPFHPFRTVAVLLSLRTLELGFAGAADRAAASLISSLRMLRVFETEPVLITHLVRLAVWERGCADLPAVLGAGTLSETSLGDLDEALKLAEAPDLLKRTIEGERVWEMNQLAAILGPDWPDGELQSASAKRRPFWERRRLVRQASDYVAVTAAMTHAAGEPWPQVFGAMPAAFRIPKLFSPDMSADLASSLPMERAGQALAATRAGRVAIAVERYRRRQGKLPVSLTDLASPLPADPFTGHDLLYRRAEDAFVVASMGPARATDARAVDEKGRPQGVSVCFARPGR